MSVPEGSHTFPLEKLEAVSFCFYTQGKIIFCLFPKNMQKEQATAIHSAS
jgi:hypothetical protein